MCTPQFQQAAQYAAQQRALDAGISPQDAAANGGQYGVLPQESIEEAAVSMPTQQYKGQIGQSIADAVMQSGILGAAAGGAAAGQPQHMMRKELAPMPVRRAPTVGELLGIPPGTTQEVGGPGRF
jgi:hypothetical protein